MNFQIADLKLILTTLIALSLTIILLISTFDTNPEKMLKKSKFSSQGRVKILGFISTHPGNHNSSVVAVLDTWAKRFEKFLVISSKNDSELGIMTLPGILEGHENLWSKTRITFKYIYDNFFDHFSWFLKADDDTFVIVENLVDFLKNYDPTEPIYFGCHFKSLLPNGYMSGGSGYILSREALRRFVEIGLLDEAESICNHKDFPGHAEDYEIGRCMQNLGVKTGDSRDSLGRQRFLPLRGEYHVNADYNNDGVDFWFWKTIKYPTKMGLDQLSDTPISFHYVTPNKMYFFESLIYNVKVFNSSRIIR